MAIVKAWGGRFAVANSQRRGLLKRLFIFQPVCSLIRYRIFFTPEASTAAVTLFGEALS